MKKISSIPAKTSTASHFMKTLIRTRLHINWDEAAMQARSQQTIKIKKIQILSAARKGFPGPVLV